MIVADENLADTHILNAIAKWYQGQVIPVTNLRPRSIIKDDAVSTLLLQVDQPTFVTINVRDYCKRTNPHPNYSVVCIAMPQERAFDALQLLRPFLRLASKTKAARMGKVFHLIASHIEYYGADKKIQTTSWLD